MIVDGNPHQLTCLYELLRDADVLTAGFGILTGMLMRQDDRGRIGKNSRLKNLPWFYDACRKAADADLHQPEHGVGGVEQHNEEFFPVFVCKVVHEKEGYFFRCSDAQAVAKREVLLANKAGGVEGEVGKKRELVGTSPRRFRSHENLLSVIAVVRGIGAFGVCRTESPPLVKEPVLQESIPGEGQHKKNRDAYKVGWSISVIVKSPLQ